VRRKGRNLHRRARPGNVSKTGTRGAKVRKQQSRRSFDYEGCAGRCAARARAAREKSARRVLTSGATVNIWAAFPIRTVLNSVRATARRRIARREPDRRERADRRAVHHAADPFHVGRPHLPDPNGLRVLFVFPRQHGPHARARITNG